PDPDAGCSLAATIQPEDVLAWRATHPDGLVVAYVNCSAAVKAEADYCCTSGNAVAVVRALPPAVPVLFVPDFFLGSHVRRVTGRAIDVWMGNATYTRRSVQRTWTPSGASFPMPSSWCIRNA